jgi:DNA-binding CsgD family transcriptional regulator
LRSRFGLTAGEARVALEMTSAEGRAAAAQRLGVSVATLKTHLVRIFEKTGVSRQAELVRLLLEETQGL